MPQPKPPTLKPILRRAALVSLLAAAALAAPVSRPTDKPVRQTVEVLTAQGGSALAAKDSRASLDAYLDAVQLLKTDKTIPPLDPLRVQAMHGLAVAYLQAGRFDKAGDLFKANDVLDKAMSTPAVPRSLVINRAVLDLTQKFNVMRAVKSMKDYLTAHPENDELMLNLLGTALDRAAGDERFSKAPLFDQTSKFYTAAALKLEQANPGQRRWGVQWISDDEFASRDRQRQEQVTAYNHALDKLKDAGAEERSAASDLARERSQATSGRAGNLAGAQSRERTASMRLSDAQKDAEDKHAAIVHFPWLTTLQAVLPDADAGGETVAIAIDTGAKPAEPAVPVEKPAKKPRNKPGVTTPDAPADVPADPPAPVLPTADNPPAVRPAKAGAGKVTRYATAFPVAPDLLLTTRAAVDQANSITLEDAQGNTFKADFVREDEKSGLALVRVAGQKFAFLNLGETFAGGDVHCAAFPNVSIFSPTPESLAGRSGPIKAGDAGSWFLTFPVNPRLGGAPVTTADRSLVGVAMALRDSSPNQIPAVRLDVLKAFLGDDQPKTACANSDPSYVLMLTAIVSR